MMRTWIAMLVFLFCTHTALAQFTQQGPKLVWTDAVGNVAQQGGAVAISADGNTLITGGSDDDGKRGAAWIWTRTGGVWNEQGAKMVGAQGVGASLQGWSVAISSDGNTAIVGGMADNASVGAAWIWTRSGGVWTQQGPKLTASDAVGAAYQGTSVAISGDGNRVLIGALNDNNLIGAAWIWDRDASGTWTQTRKLVGSHISNPPSQGWSVALSSDGNTAAVGGIADSSGVGATWVWTLTSQGWTEQAKLVGSQAIGGSWQGRSVALSADGTVVIVGGNRDDSNHGAAWVWKRSGTTWTQQDKLIAVGNGMTTYEATSVDLSSDGNTAAIGAFGDSNNAGTTWIWKNVGGTWTQPGSKLVGTGATGAAGQGTSVTLSADGSTLAVGGPTDNANAGAVWVFTAAPTPPDTTVLDVQPPNCPPGYANNGATCFRGAETISNGGSRVADCPPGYTNTGASCFRGGDGLGNGGFRVADCPPGYTNNGVTCGRGAITQSNGGSRVADCPTGFRNMGASCYRAWPPQSLSWNSMTCNPNEFRSGGRCYTNCPAGFVNTGESCFQPASTLGLDRMSCNPDEFRSGGLCYKGCPDGYTNNGSTCYRPPSTLGMDSMSCLPAEFKSGARCYWDCPLDYTNTGVSCFRQSSVLTRSADINWMTPSAIAPQQFYNIAHMTNTVAAATWAMAQGANGLEMDLQFNSSGNPTVFLHGAGCDCGCGDSSSSQHVCQNGVSCFAATPATELLSTIATFPGLALVYIDSKVGASTTASSGEQVISLLEQQLFDRGYNGMVLVAAPALNTYTYLAGAAQRASTSPYRDRIMFGLDMVPGSTSTVVAKLQELTGSPRLVYSTGVTSCLASTFYTNISAAVASQVKGDLSLSMIWTIDAKNSMVNYLNLGVRGIVTNRPGELAIVLRQRIPQVTLASPGYRPPASH